MNRPLLPVLLCLLALAATLRADVPARYPQPRPPDQERPASGQAFTYVVQNHDTLSAIAQKCHVTIAALTEANPGLNPNLLKIGQKITIPANAPSPILPIPPSPPPALPPSPPPPPHAARSISKALTQSEAVQLAETFIIENGYTDLPATRAKLAPESMEFYSDDTDAMLLHRHDTLERKAESVTGGSGAGWTVVFRYAHQSAEERGRAVTMNSDGSNLTVQHQEVLLTPLKDKD